MLVLHVAGLGYVCGMLLTPLIAAGLPGTITVRFGVSLIWSVRAALGLYGRSLGATLWRTALVAFLHFLGTMLLALGLTLGWVLLFGGSGRSVPPARNDAPAAESPPLDPALAPTGAPVEPGESR